MSKSSPYGTVWETENFKLQHQDDGLLLFAQMVIYSYDKQITKKQEEISCSILIFLEKIPQN